MLRIFRILIFISACFRERSGTKKAFIGAQHAAPKEALLGLRGSTTSRGISANPSLSALEMRQRRKRCTCIYQNLAFAPRDKVLCIKSRVLMALGKRDLSPVQNLLSVGADSISAQ